MAALELAPPHTGVTEKKIHVAIFDLDRTVTRIGTYSPFLLFAARRLNPFRLAFAPLVPVAMVFYKLRLLSRKTLKEWMYWLMLGNAVTRERMDVIAQAFAVRTMSRNIYPQAVTLIARERASGATVVIASAAHEFYLLPLCSALGVDHAIGTKSVTKNLTLGAAIQGRNCYGDNKLRRIEAFLCGHCHARGDIHVRFYSDDLSDLPGLMFADEAIATNPSRKLLLKAREMDWTVLDWRH